MTSRFFTGIMFVVSVILDYFLGSLFGFSGQMMSFVMFIISGLIFGFFLLTQFRYLDKFFTEKIPIFKALSSVGQPSNNCGDGESKYQLEFTDK